MQCPYCSSSESKVIDKRDSDGRSIRRRRECLKCKKRYTTYERIEQSDFMIVKKNGNRESYDRQKLRAGVMKACEKRPVSNDRIEKMLDEIESELRKKDSVEIESRVLGHLVMKHLKRMDKVAYIRFASVYREFADLESFQDELRKLIRK